MHIPDSVLSPHTCAVAGLAMAPVWAVAGRKVRKSLGTRQAPMLALGAAFCFTIMMFNLPAPFGTTAHPVAGTLLAILLGPWAACIGISVALLIQALFFGDGGLAAYGANCLTMAFILPFTGYAVYRATASIGSHPAAISVRSAIGAYFGINAAAAVVAVLLGIQPALFHEPNGHAIYFPFGLNVTLPAMLAIHLIVAGPAEAIVTALAVRYLLASSIPLYGQSQGPPIEPSVAPAAGAPSASDRRRSTAAGRALWIGLVALAILTPLGLLAKGDAWGEWDASGIARQTERLFGAGRGYTPRALQSAYEHGYHGLHGLEDYASADGKNRLDYIGAALLGIAAICSIVLIAGRLLAGPPPHPNSPPLPHGREGDLAGEGAAQANGHRGGEATDQAQGSLGGDGANQAKGHLASDATDQAKGHPGNEGAAARPATPRLPQEEALTPSPHHVITSSPHRLPAWLLSGLRPDTAPGARRRNPFVERTLAELAAAGATALQSDRWAEQPGLLQGIDARAKIVTLLLLIVVTGLTRRPPVLAGLYAIALALGLASRLPLRMLLRRVWLAVPVFVAAIALPLVLTTVTPGRELFPIWPAPRVGVSAPGLALAATLTLRVGTAVTFALLLTETTRWTDLLAGLRTIGLPRVFLTALAMTYRYIVVSLQTAAEVFTARRSRTIGRTSDRDGRRFIGSSIGALFGKSMATAEEVHAAMLSRGFRGEIRTLRAARWRPVDTAWTAAVCAVAVASGWLG
ncbi:MAG TPA: cobalt transporter CbiM [Chthonomonadaceae bacterium]|nr:cobalt transporter CbiM [Chthonomonadaceae bacterium]